VAARAARNLGRSRTFELLREIFEGSGIESSPNHPQMFVMSHTSSSFKRGRAEEAARRAAQAAEQIKYWVRSCCPRSREQVCVYLHMSGRFISTLEIIFANSMSHICQDIDLIMVNQVESRTQSHSPIDTVISVYWRSTVNPSKPTT